MHVRNTFRRRGNKVYKSVQIVQSYRRPDGMPANKVLGSFGDLPPLEVENLKRALAASRQGQAVVLPSEIASRFPPRKTRANLEYLDVAVAYQVWQSWGLNSLIDELLPDSQAEVSLGEVAAALTVQRCVAPASKLEATRWYPKTALVELQAISPSKFNNTRVHRVLEAIEIIEEPLQQRLAQRIQSRAGRFVCLFLDCTDTWFVGHGPESASKRSTKEGMLRRLIGIALMCDQRGYPLRWATLPGNHDECDTMMGMLRRVAHLPWVDKVPVVVDRAMGRGVTVGALLSVGIRFVTAVPVHEIASYTDRIPLGGFDAVVHEQQDSDEARVKRLGQAALDAGFHKVTKDRYVLDLGVFDKGEHSDATPSTAQGDGDGPSRAVAALRLAWRFRADLEVGEVRTSEQLAERYACTGRQIDRWLSLLKLSDEIQQCVLAGHADRLSPSALESIARLPPEQQRAAFEEARRAAGKGAALRPTRLLAQLSAVLPVQVRGVVLFNPERFLEQRRKADEQRRKLHEFIDELNRRLRSPHSRRRRDSVLAAVGGELKHRRLQSVYDIEVETIEVDGRTVFQVRLHRDDEQGKRRRSTDGLTLIVAHPEVVISAAELVELYFSKDQVEKDFQTIKSVINLRPVRHRTDLKVRAHVSVCMLALHLERSIEQRLVSAGISMTAEDALKTLHSVHLNQYDTEETPTYSVTELNPDQRAIVVALEMENLAEDDQVVEILTPR
jgi:transposase